MEEVGRAGVGLGAGRGEFEVGVGEAQRLVRRAMGDLVEVVADHRQRASCKCALGRGARDRFARHRGQQVLGRIRKTGEAVEADDGQRPAYLVQVSLGELQAGGLGAGLAPVQCAARTFERGVDLTLDPGQRTQVRLGGVCHVRPSRVRPFRP